MRRATAVVGCTLWLLSLNGDAPRGASSATQEWPRINDRLELRYTLEAAEEEGGDLRPAAVTQGFESGDRFTLRVRPTHDAYLYLFVSASDDWFTLVSPGPGPAGAPASSLAVSESDVRLPAETVLRLDEDPGVERLYLLASTERVDQVEELLQTSRTGEPIRVNEAWLIDLRDVYARNGLLTRQVRNEAVRLDYRQRGRGSAVIFETITIRHYRAVEAD